MIFLVGWTKEPAISSDLIRQVKGAIKEEFLQESQSAVKNLEKRPPWREPKGH